MTPSQETVRELLEALVAAYSPSGKEAPAAEVLAQHLPEWGMTVRQDDVGNVIARTGAPDPAVPHVVLLGHIDTVPGELEVRWAGDVLHGRGAVDAKGPLVSHAIAAASIPPSAPLDVTLVGAVGEEATSRGARHLLETLEAPDAFVVAEPTGLSTVGLGYKGRLVGRLVAGARPAHAAEPSPTAPERLIEAIDALTAWTDNPKRDVGFDETTLRVTDVASRRGPDQEEATASLDLRYPGSRPGHKALSACLPADVELEIDEALPAVEADPRTPLATALRGALLARDREPRAAVKTGTSDWNVVADAWSGPAVAYGPGDPALDHTPDERVSLDAVLEAGWVLSDAIGRLADRLVDASEPRAPGSGG